MIATPHMLTGAVIGACARTRAGAFALGAASHLALDAIPHIDYPPFALGGLIAAGDLALGAILTGTLTGGDRIAAAGAVGGAAPDLVALAESAAAVRLTRVVHEAVHARPVARRRVGVATQVAVSAAALAALAALPARRDRAGW